MKERPILFSGEMVKAILDGKKTQTRRAITQVRELQSPDFPTKSDWVYRRKKDGIWEDVSNERLIEKHCPYGVPGDRLWVRERHAFIWPGMDEVPIEECDIEYYADDPRPYPGGWEPDEARGNPDAAKWRPSIHMPRWASRITLEITDVRVERIKEICARDVIAEGCSAFEHEFIPLWNKINEKRGFGWDVNPWVWVVEFNVV